MRYRILMTTFIYPQNKSLPREKYKTLGGSVVVTSHVVMSHIVTYHVYKIIAR